MQPQVGNLASWNQHHAIPGDLPGGGEASLQRVIFNRYISLTSSSASSSCRLLSCEWWKFPGHESPAVGLLLRMTSAKGRLPGHRAPALTELSLGDALLLKHCSPCTTSLQAGQSLHMFSKFVMSTFLLVLPE